MQKKFLSLFMSVVMVCTLLVGIQLPSKTAKAASENILDVYEVSYYNYAKRHNVSLKDQTFVVKGKERPDTKTISPTTTISKSYSFTTADGNFTLTGDSYANSFTLASYVYNGSENEVNLTLPDKIRFHYISSTVTDYSGEENTYTYNIQSDYVASITDIGTAFNKANYVAQSLNSSLKLVVPGRVTTIANNAFEDNTKLTAVEFKGDIQNVGTSAFKGCTRLRKLDLSGILSAMNTVPEKCFYQCNSLENIQIPSTILNIGDYAFYQCDTIDYLMIPETIKYIGKQAFAMCSNLRYLYIPSNYQDWSNIVTDTERNKLITKDISNTGRVVKYGNDAEINSHIFNKTECAIISAIDIVQSSVRISTVSGAAVKIEPYFDTTYGYKTLAFKFMIAEKGVYDIYAEDLVGNKIKKTIVYSENKNDTESPVITIKNENEKDIYQKAEIICEEKNTFIDYVSLDGKKLDIPNECGKYQFTVSEEGTHTVTAVDWYGNTSTKTFTIDKTSPVIEGIHNGDKSSFKVTVKVKDNTGIKSIKVNQNACNTEDSSYIFATSGDYTMLVEDYAGNQAYVHFVVDVDGPSLKDIIPDNYYTEPVVCTFSSVCGISSAVLTYRDFDNNQKTAEILDQYVCDKDGYYSVTLKDTLGQTRTVSFYVDRTMPVVKGIKDNSVTNKNVSVSWNDNSGQSLYAASLNGKNYYANTTISEEGRYELIISDKAGNKNVIRFTIDKTAPAISGVKNKAAYRTEKVIKVSDRLSNIKSISVNGKTVNIASSLSFKKDGIYQVVVKDNAGNKTSVTFMIDKTKPVIKVKKNKITISDKLSGIKSVYLNGKKVKKNFTIKKKGKYTIKVVDNAGNQTIKKVTIK